MTAASEPHIVETTLERFEADVIERSRELPVVLDFWAEWCGPCRQLSPLLESLAREFAGRFVLVKANVEQMPDYAGAFGVQSIPAVFGVRDGQIVDQFLGLLPPDALRQWIERLLPTPAETALLEGQRLLASDPAAAEKQFREALALMPRLDPARVGLAQALFEQQKLDEARQLVSELEARGFLEPEAERIRSGLQLEEHAEDSSHLDELRQAAAAAPGDFALQLRLAEALAGGKRYEEALERCLDLVKRDRKATGEPARETMVAIFRSLGDEHPLTQQFRRQLSMALY